MQAKMALWGDNTLAGSRAGYSTAGAGNTDSHIGNTIMTKDGPLGELLAASLKGSICTFSTIARWVNALYCGAHECLALLDDFMPQ